MTTNEFFNKTGIKPTRFKGGLLGVPTNKLVPMRIVMNYHNIPRCGPEFKNALQTCFCRTKRELMIAISTAALVSNHIELEHSVAGAL